MSELREDKPQNRVLSVFVNLLKALGIILLIIALGFCFYFFFDGFQEFLNIIKNTVSTNQLNTISKALGTTNANNTGIKLIIGLAIIIVMVFLTFVRLIVKLFKVFSQD